MLLKWSPCAKFGHVEVAELADTWSRFKGHESQSGQWQYSVYKHTSLKYSKKRMPQSELYIFKNHNKIWFALSVKNICIKICLVNTLVFRNLFITCSLYVTRWPNKSEFCTERATMHTQKLKISKISDELFGNKLYPTLGMDVMSPRILCWTGLKYAHCYQVAGKYARHYKKG